METPQTLPEEFLHYVWENRLFFSEDQRTREGDRLEILNPGQPNSNAGPDFFNGKIRIGETIWAGNIEIHKKASDWIKHNHHSDKAYENVVLHVVEKADRLVYRSDGTEVPAFEFSWPDYITRNYKKLLEAQTWIPCEKQFHRFDALTLRLGFNRLMIERLEHLTGEIEKRLKENKNDWNEAFFQLLARMFGFKVNSVPFELLARTVTMSLLLKHQNSLFQIEALLFGNSGMLNDELLGDPYYIQLRKEYSFLYKKYHLTGMESYLWKFMRLRPVNFPTIRISQLAALIHGSGGLFSRIMESCTLKDLQGLFRVKASEYWNSHYRFNKATRNNRPKELGERSINTLIINVVVPFLFVYGEKQHLFHLKDRALDFLEKLPPENNAIVRRWIRLGVVPRSAFESQALLWLKNRYCNQKRCLNCPIGHHLIRSRGD